MYLKQDKYLSDDNSEIDNKSERSSLSGSKIEKYGKNKYNRSKRYKIIYLIL